MFSVSCITVGEFQQNCRLLVSSDRRFAVLVDPGGEGERLLQAFKASGASELQIWLTHSHIDHCGAVAKVVAATGAKVWGHLAESYFRKSIKATAARYGLNQFEYDDCPEPNSYLVGGEVLRFGEHEANVLFTPGHSPGHLCYYFRREKVLLAGDLVFQGSVGRTDLPGGDSQVLLRSIHDSFLSLPDDVAVLSGHGADTTVGAERESNPFF